MHDLFHDIYEVKRLAPGYFMNFFEDVGVIAHDCTTLDGSSGSCVIDVYTGMTVGLHFNGKYRTANYALALWKLEDDALFKGRGLNFD